MRRLLTCWLLLGVLVSPTLAAQNAFNATTAQTFPTLSAAVKAASAGDSLVLLESETGPMVRITVPLTLNGNDQDYTTPGTNGFIAQPAILIEADGVTIRDLETIGGLHGFQATETNNLQLINVGASGVDVHGILVEGSLNVVLDSINVERGEAEAIRLTNVSGASLTNLALFGPGDGPQMEPILLEANASAVGTPQTVGVTIGGLIITSAPSLFILRGDGTNFPALPIFTPGPGSTLTADFTTTVGVPGVYLHYAYGDAAAGTLAADLLACGTAAPGMVVMRDVSTGDYLVRDNLMTSDMSRTLSLRPQAAVDASQTGDVIRLLSGNFPGPLATGNKEITIRFGR